jgi:hypothetical protein
MKFSHGIRGGFSMTENLRSVQRQALCSTA